MKKYTMEDLIYLAGFFDGEGSIGLRKDYKNNTYAHTFKVTNTNLEVLMWIARTFGGAVKPQDKKGSLCGYNKEGTPYKRNADSYYWKLDILNTKILLPEIIPYLKIKKHQAVLLLEYIEKHRGHQGASYNKPSWYLKWQEEIFQKMKNLNSPYKYDNTESETIEENEESEQLNIFDFGDE